jgi:hypothetical protein
MKYCDRCGEILKTDECGVFFIEPVAEVSDKDDNHLIIHQMCMVKTDKIA